MKRVKFWQEYKRWLFGCAIYPISGWVTFHLLRQLWQGTSVISPPWGHVVTVGMGLMVGGLLFFLSLLVAEKKRKTVKALYSPVLFHLLIGVPWAYFLTGLIVGSPGFRPLRLFSGVLASAIVNIAILPLIIPFFKFFNLWPYKKSESSMQ